MSNHLNGSGTCARAPLLFALTPAAAAIVGVHSFLPSARGAVHIFTNGPKAQASDANAR